MANLDLATRLALFQNARTTNRQVLAGTVPVSNGWFDQPRLQLSPPCAGVELGYFIHFRLQLSNTGTVAVKASNYGLSNLFSLIRYTDPFGTVRHSVSGKMLELLTTTKQGRAVGSVNVQASEYPVKAAALLANNFPDEIAAGSQGYVDYTVYLPLVKDHNTFIGAIPAFASGSSQMLEIEFANQNTAFNHISADKTDAVLYGLSNTAPTVNVTSCSYDVTMINKEFGLPTDGQGNLAIPYEYFNQGYFLQERIVTGLSAGGETLIPYSFGRTYYSTLALVDNGGRAFNGSDVTRLGEKGGASQAITDLNPRMFQLKNSLICENALPQGAYWFPYGSNPLSINQTAGNFNVFFQMATVQSGARIVFLEEYSSQNEVSLGMASR